MRRQERKLLHKNSLRFIPLLCLCILVHFILSIVGASGKLAG